jgi:hypothetical protein
MFKVQGCNLKLKKLETLNNNLKVVIAAGLTSSHPEQSS